MGMNTLEARRRVIAAQPHKESQSGAVVSFSTYVPQALPLTVDIDPVQDLNGYDFPWSGGCGKNLLDKSTNISKKGINESGTVVTVNNGNYTQLIPVAVGETYTFSAISQTDSWTRRVHGYSNGTWVEQLGASNNSETVGEKYSITVTIPSGIDAIRVSYCNADGNGQFEYGGTSTDYVPYSNICPISGWTGAKITNNKTNIIPTGTDTSKGYVNGYYLTPTSSTKNSAWMISEYIPVQSGKSYTLDMGREYNNTTAGIGYYDESQGRLYVTAYNKEKVITYTIPDGVSYVRISLIKDQFNNGATFKESFIRDVTFPPGTVYGGKLTVNKDGTGRLVSDWNKLVVTNSDTLQASGKGGGSSYAIYKKTLSTANRAYQATPNGGDQYGLFSQGKWQKAAYGADRAYAYSKTEIRIALISFDPDVDLSTSAGRQAYFDNLASKNIAVEVCYKLETPQTYELTASQVGQILALKGENNVFADTGNLSVEYWTN